MPAYTWTTGETITAAKLQALEDEAWRIANLLAVGSSTAISSHFSASWANAAANVTFVSPGTSVYVQVSGGNIYSIGGYRVGVNLNGTDYAVCDAYNPSSLSFGPPYAGGILVTGLTAGATYTATTRIWKCEINRNGFSRQTIAVYGITK